MISATVVAITGSVGKTTTKSLTRQVLSSHFKTCATKGNFNNELGAPYTVLSADSDCEMLVVEMGMDDLGQIAHICSFARPDMGLINNVGVSHLERLGTRENIARAKAELFEALPEGGKAFVNNADDMADFVCELAVVSTSGGAERIFFDGTGAVPESAGARAVWAKDISVDDEGRPRFMLCARGFDSCLWTSERGAVRARSARNPQCFERVRSRCDRSCVRSFPRERRARLGRCRARGRTPRGQARIFGRCRVRRLVQCESRKHGGVAFDACFL